MAFLSTREAAKYVGRDETTLRRAVMKGKLSSAKNAEGNHEFVQSELDRYKTTLKSLAKARMLLPDGTRPSGNDTESALHAAEKEAIERENQLLRSQIADLRNERDEWKDQAKKITQLLEFNKPQEIEKNIAPQDKKETPVSDSDELPTIQAATGFVPKPEKVEVTLQQREEPKGFFSKLFG